MNQKLLKAFVVGSCWFVFAPLFLIVSRYHKDKFINYSYYCYSIFCPLYFGLWSTLAVFVSIYFKMDLRFTFFVISVISSFTIMAFITVCPVYDFTFERRLIQYGYILGMHLITFNIMIANLYHQVA